MGFDWLPSHHAGRLREDLARFRFHRILVFRARVRCRPKSLFARGNAARRTRSWMEGKHALAHDEPAVVFALDRSAGLRPILSADLVYLGEPIRGDDLG